MNKKKLVMIQPNTHKVYWGWYQYLAENYDFYLIVPKGCKPIPFLKNIIYLERKSLLEDILLKFNIGFFNYKLRNLKETLEKIQPEIIMSKIFHINYSQKALRYAKKNKIPFYLVEEQNIFPRNKILSIFFKILLPYYKFIYRNILFIPVIKPSSDFLKSIGFKHINEVNVSLKTQDLTLFEPSNKIDICSITKLKDSKNVPLILQSLNYMIKTNLISQKNIKYTIYGKGPQEEYLKNLIKKYSLENVVDFKGFVKNEELMKNLNSHDLLILPSKAEPIGLVILEAMERGLGVLVSNRAGGRSYVKQGINGYHFDPLNYKDLANKILKCQDKKLRKKFLENSLKLIKENHDVEVVGNKLKNIINS